MKHDGGEKWEMKGKRKRRDFEQLFLFMPELKCTPFAIILWFKLFFSFGQIASFAVVVLPSREIYFLLHESGTDSQELESFGGPPENETCVTQLLLTGKFNPGEESCVTRGQMRHKPVPVRNWCIAIYDRGGRRLKRNYADLGKLCS